MIFSFAKKNMDEEKVNKFSGMCVKQMICT